MFETVEVIERIEEKVKFLAGRLADKQRENDHLRNELTQLQQQLEEFKAGGLQDNNEGAGKRENVSNLSNGYSAQREEWKKEINEYIEEIDACIALLKQW